MNVRECNTNQRDVHAYEDEDTAEKRPIAKVLDSFVEAHEETATSSWSEELNLSSLSGPG